MASTASALLRIAAAQLGTMEGRDRDGNWNNLQKFGEWYGMNGVPWCDIFVSWCGYHSGNGDIIPKSAYVPGRLAWARSRGLTGHWPPAPGDIGIVAEKRYAGNGSVSNYYAHIFIVEKYLPGYGVQTIEGNTNGGGSAQGNGVYRLQRRDNENNDGYIYIRPEYASSAPTPPVSRDDTRPPVVRPKPSPAKAGMAPNKPSTGLKVRVSNLQRGLGSRNEADDMDIRQYNERLGECLGSWVNGKNKAAWQAESRDVYGPMTAQGTYDLYRSLKSQYPSDPRWAELPSHNLAKGDPAMPGEELLKWMGFGIVR